MTGARDNLTLHRTRRYVFRTSALYYNINSHIARNVAAGEQAELSEGTSAVYPPRAHIFANLRHKSV